MKTKIIETERKLTKAKLTAILWQDGSSKSTVLAKFDSDKKVVKAKNQDDAYQVRVQFNPASLKVNYSNQVKTGDQSTSSGMQFVGRGTSKLSLELIFDVSGIDATDTQDVRHMSEKIATFLKTTEQKDPKDPKGKKKRYTVPGVRFQWGTFLFDGVLESMNETLDLWSEDGRPLRSTVAISLGQPGIHYEPSSNLQATPPPPKSKPENSSPAGTAQPTPAPKGKSLQSIVAKEGIKSDWKAIAAQNGIENPRHIPAGMLIDLESTASASLNAKVASSLSSSLPALEFIPFEEAKVAAQLNATSAITGTGTSISTTGLAQF